MKRSISDVSDPTSQIDQRNIFKGLKFYILPSRFGPKRLKLFETQILKFGGAIVNIEKDKSIDYCIVEETIDETTINKCKSLYQCNNIKYIKCLWISKCVKAQKLEDISNYLINFSKNHPDSSSTNINLPSNENKAEREAEYESEIQDGSISTEISPSPTKSMIGKSYLDRFACSHSSSDVQRNHNEHVIEELLKISKAYENRRDSWRALGYQKAITAIKNYPKGIESWEEAKNIRGVGESIANKVKEIIEVGRLKKVEELCENEESKVLELFMGVWGAGPATANNWYQQGFVSLDDLKKKDSLTRHQEIGLRYYEEFNQRIPRSEVEEIETQVRQVVEDVDKRLTMTVCGSYRRGKETCGDVDILVTSTELAVDCGRVFIQILDGLRQCEFLTDDLVIQEHNGNQQKFLGVCKLPGVSRLHRRIDIIVVPKNEYAPAIMYFTGSAHFNRSMRLLATKSGMSLSEHVLRKKIVADDKTRNVTGGELLPTPTEESIFEYLGLQYLPPNQRNH